MRSLNTSFKLSFRYCAYCGALLQKRKEQTGFYDRESGKRPLQYVVECPYRFELNAAHDRWIVSFDNFEDSSALLADS